MDTASKEERSRIMAQVKGSRNQSTELVFIRLLRRYGITGWRRNYPVCGHPDFVFPNVKLAVFIDGCFWHACPKHCRMPSGNKDYWKQKISRNAKRDLTITNELKRKGWVVIRFWEHDMKGCRGFTLKMNRLRRIVQQGAAPDGNSAALHCRR